MIKLIALLMLITTSAFASDDYVVLVGELVGVKAEQCEKVRAMDRDCTQMYIGNYHPVYVMHGSLEQDRIVEVQIEDGDLALKTKSKYTLIKIETNDKYGEIVPGFDSRDVFAFHRTVDGRFAVCGCPAVSLRYNPTEVLRLQKFCSLVEFNPIITFDLTHASTYLRRLYRDSGAYKTRDNQAICVRGIYVDDIGRALEKE